MKNLRIFFYLLLSLYGFTSFCQKNSRIEHFKFSLSIDTSTYEKDSEVKLTIKNISLKTIYVSSYDYKRINTASDSICGFSLNYSENYSDPLIMPELEIPFYILRPFGKIILIKKKKNKEVNQIDVDFDYFSKSQLKSKTNIQIISKKEESQIIYLKIQDFYNGLYLKQSTNTLFHNIKF